MLGFLGQYWIMSSHMTRSFSNRSISSGTGSGKNFSWIKINSCEFMASQLVKVYDDYPFFA